MARRLVRLTRAPKRLTSWFFVAPVRTALTVGGGTIITTLNAAALALRPFTIIRTRLLITIESDQASADESQLGAFGMAVVLDQAEAIGVTAVPTPVTDSGSDLWFVHQWASAKLKLNTAVGFDTQGQTQYVVDSKAMRKVDIGQTMVGVGEFSSAGDGFVMGVMGRQLIKVN